MNDAHIKSNPDKPEWNWGYKRIRAIIEEEKVALWD